MAKAATRSPKKNSPEEDISPPMSPSSTKTSMAELRKQSLSRAKEWAADRKRKKDGTVAEDEDDDTKTSKPDVLSDVEEAKDEVDILPSIPARRSTRRRGASMGVASPSSLAADDKENVNDATSPSLDDASIGSRTRRSSRRRTMNPSTADNAVAKVTKAPIRKSRRKTMSPEDLASPAVEAPETKAEELDLKPEVEEEAVEKVEVKAKANKTPPRRSPRKTASRKVLVAPVVEAPEVQPEEPAVDKAEVEEEEEEVQEEIAVKPEEEEEEEEVEEEIPVKSEEEEEEEEEVEEEITVKPEEEEEAVVQEEIAVKLDEEDEAVVQEETANESEEEEVAVVQEEIAAKSEEEEEAVVQEETAAKSEEGQEETVVKSEEEQVETESIQEEVIKEEEVETEVIQVKQEDPETEVKEVAKEEANKSTEEKTPMIESLLPLVPVFFHALVIQWTLAFAIMISFGFDWYVSQIGPGGGEDMASQRAPCVTLGLWLVTIAGYSFAFGAHSRAGWILTGLSLAMASFSTKFMTDDSTPVPSLPIYSFSGFEVNVPAVLVVLCLVGFAVVLKQPTMALEEQPQVIANEEAPQAETFEEKDEAAPEVTGPRSLIGQRVAVEKGIDAFIGTVKDYDSETRGWLVHYDSEIQEGEELNRVQLGSAFKLYSTHLSDSLKAM